MTPVHPHCRDCSLALDPDTPLWRCPECQGLLDLEFLPVIDVDKIHRRDPTLWRYREALPIHSDTHIVSLGEGFTPLLSIKLDGTDVLFKMDHLFPSGSFKDRGASVMVSKMKALGIKKAVEDSSGNAGAAVAAYCAAADISCDIFVPESASPDKLVQIRAAGARLHRISGNREDAADAVMEAAKSTYYASHVWNPWFFQGTKTVAYEICEQLDWQPPEAVVMPVGNGTLLIGAYLGFRELEK